MTAKKPPKEFTMPERMVLDKTEINFVFSQLRKHWKRSDLSALENAEYDTVMAMTGLTIKGSKIKVLENIWYSIMVFISELQTLNGLKLGFLDANDPLTKKAMKNLYDNQINRIRNGAAFVENT